jgi:D-alanyl-D-alanine carboxypeptidase
MIPEWERPISRAAIMERWAKQPLDFDPGTRWQYSNTNFVIAGEIFERVAGQPLFDALKARVFDQLGMTSVTNSDLAKLTAADAQGYFRRANGPAHEAPHEGPGWMYAAGELAMTAEDLAKWDISVIDKTILAPASYDAMETEVHLANSIGTRYGLGVGVSMPGGHRELEHSGEVSGFVADNVVFPDDGIAVAVLTNQDASGAASTIATQIANALLAVKTRSVAADEHVKQLVEGFSRGELDRALMTANSNAYFTAEAIDEYKQAIVAAGPVDKVTQDRAGKRGGMTARRYTVKCASKSLSISVYEAPDGKFEQFLIE